VNDHLPEIYFPTDKLVIQLREQTFGTLYNPSELYIEDVDLGPHATYEVVLTQRDDAASDFAKAFSIVPNAGYQLQNFTVSVANTALIDFEEADWQEFEIMVRCHDTAHKQFQVVIKL
jgi:hypothetical protein